MTVTGGCFCGAVRYEYSGEPSFMAHCQCTRCRKASGTGHSSFLAVQDADLALTGNLTFHDAPADSGNVVSRGFCPTCGSPIMARNSGWPGIAALTASCLDDPEVFQPQVVAYSACGASWDTMDPDLPVFDAMPFMPAPDM